MRLLILSLYYPPDLSAGSFRVAALVKALQAAGRDDLEVDVITSMPNRYATHFSAADPEEVAPGLRIRRIALPVHSSGMVDQAKSFSVFARAARTMAKKTEWDLVFATSSRLMTAALGAHIARQARAPLYLDIRDLFTDTMSDLLEASQVRHLLPVFHYLERRALRGARRVNVVSEGFLEHAKRIAPNQDFRVFTNGIDREFLEADFSAPQRSTGSLPVILYAGNMGEGQGLHHVVPKAASLLQGKARLRLLGDGGRRTQLENAVSPADYDNVEILQPVARSELHAQYRAADILFLHLNDHAAFHKVLPSKIFEYAATGKPMLAGVSGYAAQFLKTHVPGCEVFAPCDAEGMWHAAIKLAAGPAHWDREAFRHNFARDKIMTEMANDIVSLDLG